MANRYPLQQPHMQPKVDLSVRNNVQSAYPKPRHGMWPHHATQQLEEQNEKQREYLKQQQKLRLMTATSAAQSVSADALIENLLGKKEIFKPKTTYNTVQPINQASCQPMMVPGHLSTTVTPTIGYAITPAVAQVSSGPSSSSGMIGSFSSSVVSPEAKSSYTAIASAVPQTQFAVNLPAWLNPMSPLFPHFYREVWKIVCQEKGLVDTARIFPVLLTSGLSTDVLGYIWGLANRKVAGQLTEQELYIVLALVALAQNGCTFNNLSILNLIPQPPIPNLKVIGLESVGTVSVRDTEVISTQGKMKREDLNLNQFSSAISNSTIPVSVPDDASFDEFTDFQSATTIAPACTQITDSKDNIPFPKPDVQNSVISTTTLSSLSSTSALDVIAENSTSKCPNVMVVSTVHGHGRGIGSRLANHSLGTPKQKKSKHHHHRHHHHHNQSQITSNVPASVDEDFSEFQQAKDGVISPAEEVFPKCMLKPTLQGKTYLLKESAIRSEIKLGSPTVQSTETIKSATLFPGSGRSDFEDKLESSKTEILSKKSHLDEQNNTPESGTELPTFSTKDSKTAGVNLMTVEEDKYSALRNLSVTNEDLILDQPKAELSPASDEFGDFLSAEPVQVTNDSFADIATRERAPCTNILNIGNSDAWKTLESPQVAEFEIDDWGDFKDAVSDIAVNKIKNASEDNMKEDSEISSAFVNLDLSGSTSSASILEKEKLQIIPDLSESGEWNPSGSWDLKFKDETISQNNTDLNLAGNAGQTGLFQGFLGKIYDDNKPDFCPSLDDHLHDRDNNFSIDIQTQDVGNDDDDDFGEFVGPDAWTEEQKYNATATNMLFDGQLGSGLRDGLYGDTQSVSSLELPPLALSRHGSVPSLDLKIFPGTAERNGGNGGNQPWDMSPQGIDHQLNEWQRCLQSCLTLLQSAVEIFQNISTEHVLDEVVGSAEGKDYLQNVLEVAGVSHRVECSYKQLASSGECRKLDSLLMDINTTWSSLEQYYAKADISMCLEDESLEEANCETSTSCGVCLIDVNIAKIRNRNTSQLEYGGHVYHSVCANLWVNCVDSSLPALAIGNFSFL